MALSNYGQLRASEVSPARVRKSLERRQKDYRNGASSTNPRYNRAAQLRGEGS